LEADKIRMIDPKKYPIESVRYEILDQEKMNEVTNKTATGEKSKRVAPPPIRD